jgi:hypothetical protein
VWGRSSKLVETQNWDLPTWWCTTPITLIDEGWGKCTRTSRSPLWFGRINICLPHSALSPRAMVCAPLPLPLEMMNGCYVKTLQEPSACLCAPCLFEFVGILWDKSLKQNIAGSKCLWANLGCWLVWYGAAMLICSISKYGEISDDFFLKIKQGKFLDGHITYQSHM